MQINMTKQVPVEAKVLKVCAKVRDCFAATLVDQDGKTLKDYDGYVPGFMPGRPAGRSRRRHHRRRGHR